ncbi:hypothetical protein Ait01nite_027110 [Actinoplanes italicus]|nr:MFS transporter [Actinoplanes italicus]GIE29666.1 hypothetical protein Ait01nite_027110 [Actinoplanes italicus]
MGVPSSPAAVRGRRIVATFATTQTMGYGVLYYAFAVLLHPVAADLRTSPAAVTGALTTAILTVHLVGFLTSRGHPATFAATVAGLPGVLSVTGRLLLTAAGRRMRLHRAVAAIFAVQAIAAFLLPVMAGNRPGAILAVVLFGLGSGIASLATPQLLADRYGTTAYAGIAGTLAALVTLARAGAPSAAAGLLATSSGYLAVMPAVGVAALIAATAILARADEPPPSSPPTADAGSVHGTTG